MSRLQNFYFVMGLIGMFWSPITLAAGNAFDALLMFILSFLLIEVSTRGEWK